MKKTLFLLTIICLVITSLSAQKVQRGYVRTVEKPDKPAQYLAGAQIRTLENPNEATSQANGRFEIPVKTTAGKEGYTIINVSLTDYNLVDVAKLNKRQQYTPATIEILMISKEEENKVRKELEAKIYAEVKMFYENKLNELQGQYDEIRQLNQEYAEQMKNLPSLITKLIHMDYKNITDSLDVAIAEAYEKGDFFQACQLIDKKSSMEERLKSYEGKTEMAQKIAESAENEKESAIRDCDVKIAYFSSIFLYDSVLRYIDYKIGFSPYNGDFYLDRADIMDRYMAQYDQALDYLQTSLNFFSKEFPEDIMLIARFNHAIAEMYREKGNYNQAKEYCQKAIGLIENSQLPYRAKVYSEMGQIFHDLSQYENALEYYNLALSIDSTTGLLGIANVYYRQQKWDLSELFYKKELNEIRKKGDTICYQLGAYYAGMANLYYSKGDLDQALIFYEKELEIFSEIFGSKHPYVALAYQGIANVFTVRHQYNEALEYAFKTVEVRLPVYGENHPQISDSYLSIGSVFAYVDQYDSALKYFQKALDIQRTVNEGDLSSIATIYGNIAIVYNMKGAYDEALEYNKKVLSIVDVNTDPITVALCYKSIGNIYMSMDQNENAIKYLQQSVDILVPLFGENDLGVIGTYQNMSLAYKHLRQYDKALSILQKTKDLYVQLVGEQSFEVSLSYIHYAELYEMIEQFDSSMVYYDKAFDILNNISDDNHKYVAFIYKGKASLYDIDKQYQKALEYYNKAMSTTVATYGENNLYVADILIGIADVKTHQGEYQLALDNYKEALGMLLATLDENHSDVANVYYKMAEVYINQKDFPAALEYYNKALAIYETEKGKKSPEALEVKQAIKECKKKMKEKK